MISFLIRFCVLLHPESILDQLVDLKQIWAINQIKLHVHFRWPLPPSAWLSRIQFMHDTKEYYSTLCPTHINTCSDTHRQRQRHTDKKTHTPSQACGLRSVCLLLMSVSPGTPQLVPEGLMLVPLYVIFRSSPTVNFTFIFNKFHHMKINTQTHRHTDTDK